MKYVPSYTYPPPLGRYPLNSNYPNGLSRPVKLDKLRPLLKGTGVTSKLWLVAPAVFGTGVAVWLSLQPDQSLFEQPESAKALLLAVDVFTTGATLGLVLYIFTVFQDLKKNPVVGLFLICLALFTTIWLYAGVYLFIYRLFPKSFKGEDIGDKWVTQFFSFLYLSITSFSSSSSGDIVPTTISTRMLISIETLFFLFTVVLSISLFTLLFQG